MAFASHLDRSRGVELLVAVRNLAAYLTQPFAHARPFSATIVDWDDPSLTARIKSFAAEVAVFDNHLPPAGSAPRLVWTGHGLGWKNFGATDLWIFHKTLARFTGGDTRRPNPRLMLLCHGDTDLRWRIERWRMDAANCRKIGMPFADLVTDPPYTREQLAGNYRIDIRKKTVLLNITWHYGAVFAQPATVSARFRSLVSGGDCRRRDFEFIESLADATMSRDANLLFCLHERNRYPAAVRHRFEAIAARYPNMEIKHKDEKPDNLADLLVADVMISNYSSFITPFYLLGRPAIHIRPIKDSRTRFDFSMLTFAGLWRRASSIDDDAYMLDLDDTGGPIVETAEEAIREVLRGLDEPDSCRGTTAKWLDRHLHRPNGGAAQNLLNEIAAMCGRPLRGTDP